MIAYERDLVTKEHFKVPNFLQRYFGSPTEHFVFVFSPLLSRRRAIECWRGGKVRLIEFRSLMFQMYSCLSGLPWTTSSDASFVLSVQENFFKLTLFETRRMFPSSKFTSGKIVRFSVSKNSPSTGRCICKGRISLNLQP